MRRLIHLALFAIATLAGAVMLAAVLWQFAAARERIIYAAPAAGAAAVPLLLVALDDDDTIVQVRAGLALRQIGPDAVPVLIDSLSDPRPDRRRQAALALGIVEARQVIPQLIEAARTEPDKPARVAAVRALQPMGADAGAAVPVLVELLLANPDAGLRATAAATLGFAGRGDSRAMAALAASLGDPDARVRDSAAGALERIAMK